MSKDQDPKRDQSTSSTISSSSPDLLSTAISAIISRITTFQSTPDSKIPPLSDQEITQQATDLINSSDPDLAQGLQNLSPQVFEQVIRETVNQLMHNTNILAVASQSAEATSDVIQEALKAVLESISESSGNI